jgi:hypothetical protein
MLPSLAPLAVLALLGSIVRRASLCLALMLAAACACPPLVAGYASPEDTLRAWQAQLCRDDAQGEYGCLAASFQREMGGFASYHAARAALLEQQPAMAWLFARSDLLEHVSESWRDEETGRALLQLQSGDDRIDVGFERETWLTIEWADGRRQSFNQERPLSELLGTQLGRQWLTILKPPLLEDQLSQVRALSVEPRWKIAALAGLQPQSAAPASPPVTQRTVP